VSCWLQTQTPKKTGFWEHLLCGLLCFAASTNYITDRVRTSYIETADGGTTCKCGGTVRVSCVATLVDASFFGASVTWRDAQNRQLPTSDDDSYSSSVDVNVAGSGDCPKNSSSNGGRRPGEVNPISASAIESGKLTCRLRFVKTSQMSRGTTLNLLHDFQGPVMSTNDVPYDVCFTSSPCAEGKCIHWLINCVKLLSLIVLLLASMCTSGVQQSAKLLGCAANMFWIKIAYLHTFATFPTRWSVQGVLRNTSCGISDTSRSLFKCLFLIGLFIATIL